MHAMRVMIVGLLALFALAGCQAPGAIAPVAAPQAATQAVEARLDWGYRVQSVVSAYTKADVDHVKLTLYKAGVATGVTKTVSASALTSGVSLGNLKMAQSYRVQADAYADAAETKLISVPASSLTTFTMPSLTTTGGVASVDDAAIVLALTVKLADKTYAGTADVDVVVNGNVRPKIENLSVTLYQVAGSTLTPVSQKYVAFASKDANPTYTLTNLKAGTSYRLIAQAIDTSKSDLLSNDGKSTLNFSVPAFSGGQLDDDVNALVGALSLPCKK